MSVSRRLDEYLKQNHVVYHHARHAQAFTAQGVAAAEHISGKEVAKTIVFKVDGQFVLVVLPALWKVNLNALRDQLPSRNVELASEKEIARLFPDCRVGAMAPFGNLYDLPVYVDKTLTEDSEIVFNAGTHEDTIRMKYEDFEKLVHLEIISVAALPTVH